MAVRLAKFLERLRMRPLHERRIIGMSAYAALAAVVLILGVESLRQALALPSGAAAPTPAGAGGMPEAATPERPGPSAPLKALGEAIGGAMDELKAFVAAAERNRSAAAVPPSAPPSAPPHAAAPESVGTAPEPQPAAHPDDLAGAVAVVSGPKPYSTYDVGRLLEVPPPTSSPEAAPSSPPPKLKPKNRIIEIIAYNLRELRRTMGDLYDYLAY